MRDSPNIQKGVRQPSLARLPGKLPDKEASPFRRRNLLIALAVLFTTGGGLGAYYLFRENPNVKEVKELRAELFSPEGRKLSREERREKFKKLRSAEDKLSAKQRRELDAPRLEKMRTEMKKYFALSDKEKKAYLNKRITEMQKRFKDRQAGRNRSGGRSGGSRGGGGSRVANNSSGSGGRGGAGGGGGRGGWGGGGAGGGRGGPGGGGWGGGGRGGPGGGGAGGGPGGAGGAGGPGGQGGFGGWGGRDPQSRAMRAQQRLDNSSPDDRAMFHQFRMDMRAQMQSMGISFGGRGGPMGGGRPPR